MATLKDAINQAKLEPNSDRANKLKAAILSGKMDAVAQQEGLDLTAFKAKFGKEVTPSADWMKRAGEVAMTSTDKMAQNKGAVAQTGFAKDVNAPALSSDQQKRQDVQNILSPEVTGNKIADAVIKAVGGPLAPIAADTAKAAYQGVRDIGGGLLEQSKEMFGQDKNKDVSGEGFSQAFKGVMETISSPFVGVAKQIPGGETALGYIGKALNAPAELTGFLYESGLRAAGEDPTKPEYQQAKQQLMDAVTIATPKIYKAVQPTATSFLNWGGKKLENFGIKTTEFALPENAKTAEQMQNYDASLKLAENALNEAKKTGEVSAIESAQSVLDDIKKNKPVTTGQTATELGVSGTEKGIGIKSKVAESELWNKKIQPALKSDTTVIPKQEFIDTLQAKIDAEPFQGRRAELQEGLDALIEEMDDTYTLESANKTKTSLAEFTPAKVFRGKDIANGYNQVKADFAAAIRQKTYEMLKGENIKKAYIDYSNLKELEGLGVKARTGGGFKGGFGGFWSSLWDKVTTPILTTAGKYLYKIGDKLEFESPKPVQTFGEYLMLLGLSRDEFENNLITD